MADKVTWFELPADDMGRAEKFYNEVFEWDTSDMGGGSLFAQTAPSDDSMMPKETGAINGDISPRTTAFDKPLIVVTVDDLDAKIEKIKSAGGSVVQPREVVDEMMVWAIVSDTEGNKIGIIQNL